MWMQQRAVWLHFNGTKKIEFGKALVSKRIILHVSRVSELRPPKVIILYDVGDILERVSGDIVAEMSLTTLCHQHRCSKYSWDPTEFLAERILSVSVRSEDEDKFIQSGMTLPIGVSDGKYKENFDVIVQRCTCQGPNDNTKCADYIQKPPILNAQVRSQEVTSGHSRSLESVLTVKGQITWLRSREISKTRLNLNI